MLFIIIAWPSYLMLSDDVTDEGTSLSKKYLLTWIALSLYFSGNTDVGSVFYSFALQIRKEWVVYFIDIDTVDSWFS